MFCKDEHTLKSEEINNTNYNMNNIYLCTGDSALCCEHCLCIVQYILQYTILGRSRACGCNLSYTKYGHFNVSVWLYHYIGPYQADHIYIYIAIVHHRNYTKEKWINIKNARRYNCIFVLWGARWKQSKDYTILNIIIVVTQHYGCMCGDNFCGSGKKYIGAADGRDDHCTIHAPRAVNELALMRTLFLMHIYIYTLCGCAYTSV